MRCRSRHLKIYWKLNKTRKITGSFASNFTFKKRVDFDGSLGRGRKGSLRSLTGSSETSHSTLVSRNILFVFPFEFLFEVKIMLEYQVLLSILLFIPRGLVAADLHDQVQSALL